MTKKEKKRKEMTECSKYRLSKYRFFTEIKTRYDLHSSLWRSHHGQYYELAAEFVHPRINDLLSLKMQYEKEIMMTCN